MIIDILIPTYNRHIDLLRNLHLLKEQISNAGLQSDVAIIISDNCSPDLTEVSVNGFIKENSDVINVQYYRQLSNVGLEQNAVFVLSKSTSAHVMFLGDDDYLPQGYLLYCVKKINENFETGCIIPGLSSLLKDGTIVEGRKEAFEEKTLKPGFESAWLYSHLGHQMSGIVCSRVSLLNDYLSFPEYRNIYLFIYFVTNRLFRYSAYYVPRYKVKVTLYNEKNWSYNEIGLLDEVFKSYYPFIPQYGEGVVRKLMLRFSVMHSYRLHIPSRNIQQLLALYRKIIASIKPMKGIRIALLAFLLKEYMNQLIRIGR